MTSSYDVLNHQNFLLYCAKAYDNPHCSGFDELLNDIRRIKHIKKLITRYEKTGEFKSRLILNHIIILNNVFGPEVTVKIIWLKMNKYLKYIKPFLILLNILPTVIHNIEKEGPIYTDDTPMDQYVIDQLRKL